MWRGMWGKENGSITDSITGASRGEVGDLERFPVIWRKVSVPVTTDWMSSNIYSKRIPKEFIFTFQYKKEVSNMKTNKTLSIILSIVLSLSAIQTPVLADEITESDAQVETAETDSIETVSENLETNNISEEITDEKLNISSTGDDANIHCDTEKTNYIISRCEEIVEQIITPDMSDIEKYMALAKWERNNVSYAYDENGNPSFENNSYDAYGALKYGKAVCSGYAQLYMVLCHAAGLACDNVILRDIPEEIDAHAINYIPNINGHDYFCDITWNRMFFTIDTGYIAPNSGYYKGTVYTYGDVLESYCANENCINIKCDYHDFVKTENHKNTNYISCILRADSDIPDSFNLSNAIDTYIEKGSGTRGETHAKYEDYALRNPRNIGDWKIDDFFPNPQDIANKVFTNKSIEISGLKDSYDSRDLAECQKAIEKDIIVTFMGTVLTLNKDYTICIYSGGRIRIDGINDYSGWEDYYFTESVPSLNNPDVWIHYDKLKESYDYTSIESIMNAIRQDLLITYHDNTLQEDTDYTLNCRVTRYNPDDDVFAIYIIAKGINNFSDEKEIYRFVTNNPPVKNYDISLESHEEVDYHEILPENVRWIDFKKDVPHYYIGDNDSLEVVVGDPLIVGISDSGIIRGINEGNVIAFVSCNDAYVYKISITVTKPDTNIPIKTSNIRVKVGEQIEYKEIAKKDTDKKYKIKIDKPNIASLSETGIITGLSVGDTLVIVKTDTIIYHVYITVAETQEERNITLVTGSKILLQDIAASFADGNSYKINIDKNKVVAVNSKGLIQAKSVGTAHITISKPYEEIELNVQVCAKPTLKFSKQMTYAGQTLSANECFINIDENLPVLKWESSKPNIASVDPETGIITAGDKNGSANITAYFSIKGKDNAQNTVKVSASVSVKHPAFAKDTITMQTGQKMVLGMKNVGVSSDPSWNIEKKNAESTEPSEGFTAEPHSNKGKSTGKVVLYALEAGEYTLTATVDDHNYNCTVNVKAPVINKKTAKVKVGKKITLSLKNTKLPKYSVSWKSENEDIAVVESDGSIRGVSKGTVKIYTETGGVKNECEVSVY